jgi:hypothetical protein
MIEITKEEGTSRRTEITTDIKTEILRAETSGMITGTGEIKTGVEEITATRQCNQEITTTTTNSKITTTTTTR